ncbi:hypothetical protein [Blastochloris viridis]|uniref:VWA domain-containing protein n=1 Tax=Blastochloris viridis TaxID=1079 RepID=A0A0H5BFC4_BLAVI|nr:hypothetical protein [Blastochloris viridis]ALK09238.1 hypothetical protein BVIR_1455 [Blastochloris viridis]BAS00893.1 hypothetical protein BV133_3299 [Blastochloris viridis]CUU41901.1 hypothetical protein BVIRIDIS_09000 [Blastochloris viridis]
MSSRDSNRPPTVAGQGRPPAETGADVAAFLAEVKRRAPTVAAGERGRLIFALDATMSRQPTWDMATQMQADMFREAAVAGGLAVQLLYYRGTHECRASRWVADTAALERLMTSIDCRGGHTQIARVLRHAGEEADRGRVHALAFVGDAMEEALDDLCAAAGPLALRGVPAFLFQEGTDAVAEQAFREIARLTRGAYCRFGPGSAAELKALLQAVAAYAAGGRRALAELADRSNGPGARLLLEQMR